MPNRLADFFTSWFRSWPWRLRCLVGPYFVVLVAFVAGYAGLTTLLRPWALDRWWSIGVPAVAGFGACWLLWHPWALLARNFKGETRRLPLMLVWPIVIAVGVCEYNYLHYRLGAVRDVYSVPELARPNKAYLFRLRGPFVVSRSVTGRYAASECSQGKDGTRHHYATCYYACPVLTNMTDTLVQPAAWLLYSYQEGLGDNLTDGELGWRYQNFLARCDAHLDSLNLQDFAYLVRAEHAYRSAYRAVHASRLAPACGTPLLLLPVRAAFAGRGSHSLHWALWLASIGSFLVVFLLLVMPLESGSSAIT